MKNKIVKFARFCTDRRYRTQILCARGKYDHLPDREYLELAFEANMGFPLDLETPRFFDEKLQWLKLYDRRPEYVRMVDKVRVREYIAALFGEEYLIPSLGVWEDPDEINFDSLPERFVLKCNHNSGLGMCICRDRSRLNISAVRQELRRGLAQDYYLTNREWPYRDVERKILGEQYMVDPETAELRDYKFFCFDGKADSVMVCTGRARGDVKFFFFDLDFRFHPYDKRTVGMRQEDIGIRKPVNFDEMVAMAERLSRGIPFARIDLYSIAGRTYFGEITFFPCSGFDSDLTEEAELHYGELLQLPNVRK